MQKFEEFLNEEENLQKAIDEMVTIMMAEQSTIDEMFDEDGLMIEAKIKDVAKSFIHVGKGKGLIQYFKSAGKGIGKMFMAAIRGDVEGVKKVAKSVKATDVIDFLLKLDQATLHLITGPIHSLEAITGWHIWANVQKAQKGVVKVAEKIKQAIQIIKSNISDLIGGKKKDQYIKYLDTIDKSVSDPTSFTNLAMARR